MDNRVFLKIKLKSLAEEARIIKIEERRRKVRRGEAVIIRGGGPGEASSTAKKLRAACSIRRAGYRSRPWYEMSAQQLHELTRHRIDVVRLEARLSHLAYGMIRGRVWCQIDSCRGLNSDHWRRVQIMVKKFGDTTNVEIQAFLSMAPLDVAEAMSAVTFHEQKSVEAPCSPVEA